jgi:cytochrome P450
MHETVTDRLQFGGGSHICIGRHLALYQMNKVLPQIFRRYDMQLVSPAKLPHVTGFFYIQTGLNVYLKLHESVLASEPIDRDTSHEAT